MDVHTGEYPLVSTLPYPQGPEEMGGKEMCEGGSTHLLTLQRRIILALFLFTDDAQLGEVAQLRVDGELTELIVRPCEEVRCVCTSCGPVRDH